MSHSFSYVNAKKQKQNRWLNLVIDFIKLNFQKKLHTLLDKVEILFIR